MSRTNLVLGLLVAVVAAGIGYLSGQKLRAPSAVSPAALNRLAEIRFPDLKGQYQTLAQGKGQVQVVNYWATWCPPCRHEMPELSAMAQDYQSAGVRFVGIAVDDMIAVTRYVASAPVAYPIWLGDPASMALTAELGNRSQSLPFTLVLDREGRITYAKLGRISGPQLRAEIDALLRRQ